jgi:peptidoglycan hydrolase-like protein with peptidoglycan-binding domain
VGIAYLVIPDVFGSGTREAVRNFQPSFLVAAMVFVLNSR